MTHPNRSGKDTMINVVNIVATSQFNREFDLDTLSDDLSVEEAKYNPEDFPGLVIKLSESSPVINLYASGSFVILGAKSKQQLNRTAEQLFDKLDNLGISFEDPQLNICNLMYKIDLDTELDLESLVFILGMENTEYEPEQSSFVYYWPENLDCLITIASNGECIITGITSKQEAHKALEALSEKLDKD